MRQNFFKYDNKMILVQFVALLTTWHLANCQVLDASSNNTNLRLPTNVFPIHYTIYLKTYLPGYGWPADAKAFTFEGRSIIELNVVEETDKITLHCDSLKVSTVVISHNNENLTDVRMEETPELQFLTLHLPQKIKPNKETRIFFEFSGSLREDGKGYYISNSTSENGTIRYNAVTQFEETDARRMIPCFDEPEFKATWQVSLEHPIGSTALSNGIEVSVQVSVDKWVYTTFKETVKMSSYLLAIFVGDVLFRETKTDSGVRIRVYTDPTNIDFVNHALNVSRIVLEGFEKHFGINYPMEKLDYLSVNNFNAGAMENWGLIVHRPSTLLGASEYVTDVIIHETSHQWFGNLVTMKFWNQLWLNEGFASYITALGRTFLDPTFDRGLFIVEYQLDAQSNDYYPLNALIKGINESFVAPLINYSKGCSLIRMLEMLIGTENFDNGIRSYLSEYQYTNVEDINLYKSLSKFSQTVGPDGKLLDIEQFAKCWTHQNGHPTVYVERNDGVVTISQRRDVQIPSKFKVFNECAYKWDIPIWYQHSGNQSIQLAWLGKDKYELELNVKGPVIVNAESYGFFDVVYSEKMYESIASQLTENPEVYSSSTRFRLLHDTAHKALNKKIPLHSLVTIGTCLTNDTNSKIKKYAVYMLNLAFNHLSVQLKQDQKDMERIKSHTAKLSREVDFFKCGNRERFSDCFRKTFKSENEACFSMKTGDKDAITDHVLKLLKAVGKSNREELIAMLGCGNEEAFKKVAVDRSFEWTALEKGQISRILERIDTTQQLRKERKGLSKLPISLPSSFYMKY